jgi:hypothetical protein
LKIPSFESLFNPQLRISLSKNMKPTYYSEISEGAMLLHEQILACASVSPEIQSLYKGCQLLFSPFMERLKILLIGFNPGGGYYNWHGRIVEEFQPVKALEYYLNSHPLSKQIKSFLHLAGREEDLKNHTVKTNFYYWATDNLTDFNKLLKLLKENLSQKIFHFARVWTKQLKDGLQADLIIVEGSKAFDEVKVLFSKKLQEKNSESVRSFTTPQGRKMIGYKRKQSRIISKEEIVKKCSITIGERAKNN